MTEQNDTQNTNVQTPQTPPARSETRTSDGVMLSNEQYNSVLDALAELEDLKSKSTRRSDTMDDLVEDGRAVRKPPTQDQPAQRNVEDLSQRELAAAIMEEVNARMVQPLLVKIETMRVDKEIESITSKPDLDGKTGEEHDFFNYRKEIYDVASQNPNLSLRQAYKLAKEQAGDAKSRKSENIKDDTLRTLPPRAKILSERPGPSKTVTDQTEPETRGEATNQAIEAMRKKGIKI